MDCLFCKIVNNEIPADIVYETETVLGFRDISPQAPTHILVIPKDHIENVLGFGEKNATLVSQVFEGIKIIAQQEGLDAFRVVANTGEASGQTVFHCHFHLLGGRPMKWPPG